MRQHASLRLLLAIFALYVVLIADSHTASQALDIDQSNAPLNNSDTLVKELLVEARHTWETLSNAGEPLTLEYEEFESTFVILGLRAETERVLSAKGLSWPDLDSSADASPDPSYHSSVKRKDDFESTIPKKDAPTSAAAMLEQLRVQTSQASLILARQGSDRPRELLVGSRSLQSGNTWRAEKNCAKTIYAENWYAPVSQCSPTLETKIPCQRVVRDNLASHQECQLVAVAADRAMVGLFHQGGATAMVPDDVRTEAGTQKGSSRSKKNKKTSRLGTTASQTIAELAARVKASVEFDHGLPQGSLYSSGSLLTRLKADYENDIWERNHSHVYWNFHVDKANIASYDYSALLYLNDYSLGNEDRYEDDIRSDSQVVDELSVVGPNDREGVQSKYSRIAQDATWSGKANSSSSAEPFEGGLFAFLDEDKDRLVAPRCGRLLSFSSGLENPHRVEKVTRGSRLVLALWFTCSAQNSYGSYARALDETSNSNS